METEGMEIGGSQFVWLCVKQDEYQIEFFIKEPEYDLESIKEDFRLASCSLNIRSGVCLPFIMQCILTHTP